MLTKILEALIAVETRQLIEDHYLKPLRLFGAAVDQALAPLRTAEFSAEVARIARQLQLLDQWLRELPNQLKEALSDAGTIPHPELTLQDLATVMRAHQTGGHQAAVSRIQHLNEELFAQADFRSSLRIRWHASRRHAVLEQVLSAHEAGLYAVSIPAALAQAEGIVADAARHTGAMKLRHYKGYITQLGDEPNVDGPSVEHFVENFLLASFRHGDPVPSFSRHAILHGADVDYGSKEKSIRALVWVDYLLIRAEEQANASQAVLKAPARTKP
ncbi:MAG: hypothetical protein ACOY0T_27140 [Myxococcota bacterium]